MTPLIILLFGIIDAELCDFINYLSGLCCNSVSDNGISR
ncbi:hypothetical protein EPIR_2891 [Erwinia piriflorinigrans CFBP 5888]|uniref:Uncharacterized protein n=1 Tax=Erwinia piriflorinigrans CFBP 5888 TaxID=1161919 RepID=V5ZBC7_9GAMM|nr:hypothetical protein EPIR_2891 [Erwinia piriflorinigrans CFBP 5888]